jgi:hypothetical protein
MIAITRKNRRPGDGIAPVTPLDVLIPIAGFSNVRGNTIDVNKYVGPGWVNTLHHDESSVPDVTAP